MEIWGQFLSDSSVRFKPLLLFITVLFFFYSHKTHYIQPYQEQELHRLVYFGGVAPSLRKEVWPFLLGHYHFTMTEKCRLEVFFIFLNRCPGVSYHVG